MSDWSDLMNTLREDLVRSGAELPPDAPPDASWATLGLDSLTLAEFAARVERRHRVPIPDDALRGFGTLEDIARWLQAHRR